MGVVAPGEKKIYIPGERRHQGQITTVTEQMYWATVTAYKKSNKNNCNFLSKEYNLY